MIRFISFCTKPDEAAKKAVIEPINTITIKAKGLYSKIHEDLNNK